jgi:hypothetical protein
MAGTPDFDIGKQASLAIVVAGAIVSTAQLTAFTSSQDTITLTSRPLGGPRVAKEIPDGWKGSFEADRLGPTLDDLFARREDAYWSAGDDGVDVILTETVKEKSGAISQYRYEGVALKFDDTGNKKQDDKIVQKVSFMAYRRREV